jgi:hypothetical protein
MVARHGSPWRYDEVLCSALRPPRPRRPIREQSPHDLRVAFDRQQQRASWRVRRAPVLFPITQCHDGEVKGFGKFRLRHSEALPEHLYTRHASHTRQPSPASPPPPVLPRRLSAGPASASPAEALVSASQSWAVAASGFSRRIHLSDAPYPSRRGSRTDNGIRPRCGRWQSRRKAHPGWSNDG